MIVIFILTYVKSVYNQLFEKYSRCYHSGHIRALEFNGNYPLSEMTPNGPAIWGGCVTRRSIRAGSWFFSQKAVTVQGGYGAVFEIMVQSC
jgi:hypothetical protein